MILVILQFHDNMLACVRLDDMVCSGWLAVEQGLRQGCVLTLLVLKMFAVVMNVAYTRFKADKIHYGRFGAPEEKERVGGAEGSKRRRALSSSLWGMPYADDTGVISQSPEQLKKMM